MFTVNQLMKYLRSKHGISVKSSQSRAIRNFGYYHGYKGYRFVRNPSNSISFSSFDEIIALNRFDMRLKTTFYPQVMFIETALKNYVIEAILANSRSENLDEIFGRSITYYKTCTRGSDNYHKQYAKRLNLKGQINSTLVRDYNNKKQTVSHFFDQDRPIPIWAVFESLSLGEFGTLFSCVNIDVKLHTSRTLNLPTALDPDGEITSYIIYTIRDLRNAIAHNNVVFEARFQSIIKKGKKVIPDINARLISLLESEIGIVSIDFKYISAYVILLVYVLRKMGETKTACKQFITSFEACTDDLRRVMPANICNSILGTQQRTNMKLLKNYIIHS